MVNKVYLGRKPSNLASCGNRNLRTMGGALATLISRQGGGGGRGTQYKSLRVAPLELL